MTTQELDILIAQAEQDVYYRAIHNNLTEAESDYYIMSVISGLVNGMTKGAYKILQEEYQKSQKND